MISPSRGGSLEHWLSVLKRRADRSRTRGSHARPSAARCFGRPRYALEMTDAPAPSSALRSAAWGLEGCLAAVVVSQSSRAYSRRPAPSELPAQRGGLDRAPTRERAYGSRSANAAVPSADAHDRAGCSLELRFFHFVRPARRVTHLQRGTHPDDSGGMPVAIALSAVASVVAAQAH